MFLGRRASRDSLLGYVRLVFWWRGVFDLWSPF